MNAEQYQKASRLEQILYDRTGMLAENHPSIIEAMQKYANQHNKELLETAFNAGMKRMSWIRTKQDPNETWITETPPDFKEWISKAELK